MELRIGLRRAAVLEDPPAPRGRMHPPPFCGSREREHHASGRARLSGILVGAESVTACRDRRRRVAGATFVVDRREPDEGAPASRVARMSARIRAAGSDGVRDHIGYIDARLYRQCRRSDPPHAHLATGGDGRFTANFAHEFHRDYGSRLVVIALFDRSSGKPLFRSSPGAAHVSLVSARISG